MTQSFPLQSYAEPLNRTTGFFKEAKQAYDLLQAYRQRKVRERQYTVRLSADHPLFPEALRWAHKRLPVLDLRQLTVLPERQTRTPDDVEDASSGSLSVPPLSFGSGYDSEVTLDVDGHAIKVTVVTPSRESHESAPEMVFLCPTLEARSALLAELNDVNEARVTSKNRVPSLYTISPSWSARWARRGDLPPRPLSSVALAKGQMERLTDDLGEFLASEGFYNQRSIPWHRGYLLHGDPGNGKTSVARALATEFGLDVWHLGLGDVSNDATLSGLLSTVHPRSMVVLEDVDVFSSTQDRASDATQDNSSSRVTLSGLLNALDGIATPHGLITVMTTNRLERLDPAVMRPGRIDVLEEVESPDDEQVVRMFAAFYGTPPPRPIAAGGRVAASISEVFKRHMHDPAAAAGVLAAPLGLVRTN